MASNSYILTKHGRWIIALMIGCLSFQCSAFLSTPNRHQQFSYQVVLPENDNPTCLEMGKRRGNLGSIVDVGESVPKTSRTAPKKRSKRTTKKNAPKKKGKDEASTISPLLQEWASGQAPEEDQLDEEGEEETTSAASFSRFDDKKSRRSAGKKTAKQAENEERKALVVGLVKQIEEVLDDSKENNKKTSDINDILDPLRKLISLPNGNTNLRQLIAGNKRQDYRLTWVGSDDAICHVGTGLHKVPLARLQEVFFSCAGKSRVEVLEVIRVLGPFPNVRNTLEGSLKIGKRNIPYGGGSDDDDGQTVSELGITYDFMIDGTGKTITAGVEDNVRRVGLHIAFCDEHAIVAVVPPEDGGVLQDPLMNNGANILFFAREETLDEKLDALRVL